MSLGATLRQARAARKLTIEDISRATRIPSHTLAAMEEDEWNKVPKGIFTRGYLRAVAREIGLDGAALAAEYDAQQAPPPEPAPAGNDVANGFSAPVRHKWFPAAPGRAPVVFRIRLRALPEPASRWMAGSATLLLLFFVYMAGRWSVADDRPAPPAHTAVDAAAPTGAIGTGAAPAVGTSSVSAGTRATARAQDAALDTGAQAAGAHTAAPDAGAPLVLDVAATRPCWVDASADGKRTIYRLLQAGDRVQARGRIVTLRVGDAGALRAWVDGEAARPLGGDGEVVTLRITRRNYRALLPPPAGD